MSMALLRTREHTVLVVLSVISPRDVVAGMKTLQKELASESMDKMIHVLPNNCFVGLNLNILSAMRETNL